MESQTLVLVVNAFTLGLIVGHGLWALLAGVGEGE